MMSSKMQKVLLGIKNKSCSYQGFDEDIINSLIDYAKQYLEVLEILGYISSDNSHKIINSLEQIDFILPYQFYMQEQKNLILVDVKQYDDNFLTKKEKIMLNTYQKMGEYLLTSMHYRNIQIESLVMCKRGTVDVPDMINGFSLLIKALSQELAEQTLSYITGKQRVNRSINRPTIFEYEMETDFHINECYQEPACLFSGVLLDDDRKTAFYDLSQICLTEDFIEFIAHSQVEGIDTLLMGLGCIKDAIEGKGNSSNKSSIAMTLLNDSYNRVDSDYIVKSIKQKNIY